MQTKLQKLKQNQMTKALHCEYGVKNKIVGKKHFYNQKIIIEVTEITPQKLFDLQVEECYIEYRSKKSYEIFVIQWHNEISEKIAKILLLYQSGTIIFESKKIFFLENMAFFKKNTYINEPKLNFKNNFVLKFDHKKNLYTSSCTHALKILRENQCIFRIM